MNVVTVIPARFGSQRLPGKPLADIHGKPMIQWVYEQASQSPSVSKTIVATDDDRIFQAVKEFGGEVLMTSAECRSGTDRVAEVACQFSADVYVNVQGDEPLIRADMIESALQPIRDDGCEMATLVSPLRNLEDLQNPSVVKALLDERQRAIYFSRFPIPYSREMPSSPPFACFRHIGIYVYRHKTLEKLSRLPQSLIEKQESLEQLRALYHGIEIGARTVDFDPIGVDTEEDLEKVRKVLRHV